MEVVNLTSLATLSSREIAKRSYCKGSRSGLISDLDAVGNEKNTSSPSGAEICFLDRPGLKICVRLLSVIMNFVTVSMVSSLSSRSVYICTAFFVINKQYGQGTYKRYIKERLCNHFCRGKAVTVSYSECVFVALVIQHTERMRRTILLSG